MEQSNLKDNLYSIILICKVYSAIRCKLQSRDWFNFSCKLKPFLAIFNKYFHIYDDSYCCKCALYWKYRFTTKYRNLEISKRLSTTGWFALKIVRYETREEGKNQITVEFYELLSDFKPRQINCWFATMADSIFTNKYSYSKTITAIIWICL